MKKKSFKLLFGTMIVGTMITTSCKKEVASETTQEIITGANEVTKKGYITKDEIWYADSIYLLEGKVVVKDGATLTIQPGSIIKGKQGIGVMSSALIIAKGSKIKAEGEINKPIIFTSELDDIKTGEFTGTTLDKKANQKWGGLIILGNAPVSTTSGDNEGNIEGIPTSDGYGKYGGDQTNDTSGILNYVSIRHGGTKIGESNEINGLTLGGVGKGTKIQNIEIYATMDDGIECFGGSVDLKNILVYNQGDDGIDLDQNYSGTIENFYVIQGDEIGTDKGIEIDGPEGNTHRNGLFILKNGIIKSTGKEGYPADFKEQAQGKIINVTFDYTTSETKDLKIKTDFNGDCTTKRDAFLNLFEDILIFDGVKFIGGVTLKVYKNSTSTCPLANEQSQAEAKVTTGNGASAIIADFSWTNASKKGELK